MIVAMCCNENWYQYLVVNIYSLLKNTKNVEKIYLLIETENVEDVKYLSEIKEKFNIKIELINFNDIMDKYIKKDCPNTNTIFSNFCFGRLMLADVIKEDKVLYLDTDTIVRKDISNLWNYDINNYYVAGVKDYGIIRDGTYERLNIKDKYINSGVVLFNLKLIREDNIIEKWFHIINTEKMKYPDQDAMNVVCTHRELYLSSMYNVIWTVTVQVENPSLIKIYHYAGKKTPWVADKHYAEEWYDSYESFYQEIVKK